MLERQLQLLRLLDDGEFHPLDVLAKALCIESSAVTETLVQLRAGGMDINSRNSNEYALSTTIEWLDAARIRANFKSAAAAAFKHIEILDAVDSTSHWLADQPLPAVGESRVCLAESQTRGRGRLGRVWQSPPVANLYLSVNWYFEAGASVVQGLSLAIGVAVAQACEALGAPQIGLKWPNDLVCAQGKLGGILIELGQRKKTLAKPGVCAIIGVGLNVKLSPQQRAGIDQPATDLCTLKSGFMSRNALAGEVLNRVQQVLSSYADNGLGPYLERWQQRDVLRDCQVVVSKSGHPTCGTALGIDAQGAYLLRTAQGSIVPIMAGTLRRESAQ